MIRSPMGRRYFRSVNKGWIWNGDTVCYTAIQLFLRIPYFLVVIRGLNRTPPPLPGGRYLPIWGGGGYEKNEDKGENEKEMGIQMGKNKATRVHEKIFVYRGRGLNK